MRILQLVVSSILLVGAVFAQDPQPPPTPPAKNLERFVGIYEVGPGRTVTISRQGDQLLGQLNNGTVNPLTAESEIRYVALGGAVTFKLDDKGQVTGLLLEFNGGEYPATKLIPQ